MQKSPKQISLEHKILEILTGKPHEAASFIFSDPEIQAIQEYANIVSIKRLGYNDHGPVHVRKATLNAILAFDLLARKNIQFCLEKEEIGTAEDSKTAVVIATMLHDMGMTVSRDKHELLSSYLAYPHIDRILDHLYPKDNLMLRTALRSMAIEGIVGHMATHKIHSLEAGLVLIGDGCDMEKGRARIPAMLSLSPRVGDIHRYSASAIQRVRIIEGEEKAIRIQVEMLQSVGLFQIEEVLFPKILSSPVKPYIELYAGVPDQEMLRYL